MNLWLAALIALVSSFAFATFMVVVGVHVTKKYPIRHDPDRNARRYTFPAGIAFLLSIMCFIAFVILVILAIVTS